MTKTQFKAIALNASRQLNVVSKDIYNRDLVTALNHGQLKELSATLDDLYGVLDAQYQRSMKAGIDEPMEYAEHIKEEMDAKAKELNLLPPVSGYTDDGQPMYRVEDIAKHLGLSVEEVEQQLLQVMESSQKVGLSNDAIFMGSNTHINRVQ